MNAKITLTAQDLSETGWVKVSGKELKATGLDWSDIRKIWIETPDYFCDDDEPNEVMEAGFGGYDEDEIWPIDDCEPMEPVAWAWFLKSDLLKFGLGALVKFCWSASDGIVFLVDPNDDRQVVTWDNHTHEQYQVFRMPTWFTELLGENFYSMVDGKFNLEK